MFPEDAFPLGIQRATHRSVGMHSHDFSELVVVTDGHGSHLTGEREYPIRAGDVFVIHGERSHAYRVHANLEIVNILFDLDRLPVPRLDLGNVPGFHALFTVEPAFRHQGHLNSRLRLSAVQMADVGAMLQRFEEQFEQRRPGWQFASLGVFMGLLSTLARAYSHIPETQQSPPIMGISKVISHLEARYASPIHLDDLATLAHMSRSSLLRACRRALGMAPIEYLLHVRINRAADLLLDDRRRVAEVAAEVGFHDSNYFSRQFRAVTGVSPREYRRRYGLG